MAIISKDNASRGRFFISVRTKYFVTSFAFIALAIAVLNIYPVALARDLVYYSKRESVLPRAVQLGASVEALEDVTPEELRRAVRRAGTDGLSRVMILDLNMGELFSARGDTRGYDGRVMLSLASEAVQSGEEVFRSTYSDGAFMTYVCVPVMSGGTVTGTVAVYQYDDVAGALVLGIRDDMGKLSAALGLTALAVSLILAGALSAGIRRVVTGIRSVREGDYSFRTELRGHDEFTQLAEEFNTLTERMQKTEERRRRFVADASHELKTPLASIKLLSDTILENENMDPETLREFVLGIREESERLARTTGQLLDLTKLDRGGTSPRVEVDASEVARRVLAALEPVAERAGITMESRYVGSCRVMAAEDDLFRIIHNLVDNAVKYNTENGRVVLTVRREGGHVVITVEDTGIGIPEEDLPYIFERFYRVEKSRGREEGGTGLGLSIVWASVEKHGGAVAVRRLSPRGTAFTVTFPGAEV